MECQGPYPAWWFHNISPNILLFTSIHGTIDLRSGHGTATRVQGGEVSRKSTESKAEPDIRAAAERTGLLIRGLQNRLADRPSDESAENLEWELQKYFAAEVGP